MVQKNSVVAAGSCKNFAKVAVRNFSQQFYKFKKTVLQLVAFVKKVVQLAILFESSVI